MPRVAIEYEAWNARVRQRCVEVQNAEHKWRLDTRDSIEQS
jgi:hypothetical protein